MKITNKDLNDINLLDIRGLESQYVFARYIDKVADYYKNPGINILYGLFGYEVMNVLNVLTKHRMKDVTITTLKRLKKETLIERAITRGVGKKEIMKKYNIKEDKYETLYQAATALAAMRTGKATTQVTK